MDILVAILVVSFGFLLPRIFTGMNKTHIRILQYLWLYHLVFALYYYLFVNGDAIGYWKISKSLNNPQIVSFLALKGTAFMHIFNYVPANLLDLSYFNGTLIYSFIGFIGLAYFYCIAIETVKNNSFFMGYKLFPLLFFLPNLHFWSVAVGKDTLSFTCIAIFAYGLLHFKEKYLLCMSGLLILYLVRPHVVLFLLAGFGMAYIFSTKIVFYKRILLALTMLAAVIIILPEVMEYAHIEEASISSFNRFSENKANLLGRSHTGSAVDIASYPLPFKFFTFLYRPLFFDINGFPALLASFENLILLLITIKLLKNGFWATFKQAPMIIKGFFFFSVVGTLAFSQSLGNLGIMIRMRNMFLPCLIIFILWFFYYKNQYGNRSSLNN